jgi:hypothetical protein
MTEAASGGSAAPRDTHKYTPQNAVRRMMVAAAGAGMPEEWSEAAAK